MHGTKNITSFTHPIFPYSFPTAISFRISYPSYIVLLFAYLILFELPCLLLYLFILAIDKTSPFSVFRYRLFPLAGSLSMSTAVAGSLFYPERGSSKYLRNSANAAIYTPWLPTGRINISKLHHSISNHRSAPHNILDTVSWNNPFTFCYRLVTQCSLFQYIL